MPGFSTIVAPDGSLLVCVSFSAQRLPEPPVPVGSFSHHHFPPRSTML
jgi:hypothetical protein